mgnify:CR=1 FL=1
MLTKAVSWGATSSEKSDSETHLKIFFMQNRKKTLLSNYTDTIIRIIIYILMLKILS